jgi:hypothetical protein
VDVLSYTVRVDFSTAGGTLPDRYLDQVRREQEFLADHPDWRVDRIHSEKMPCMYVGVRTSDGAEVKTDDLRKVLDLMEGLAGE